MSTSARGIAVTHDAATVSTASRARDFLELSKPRITVLELVTAVAGLYLAAGSAMPPVESIGLLVGAGLLGASANALNMYLERRLDRLMQRTANRPLPSGRMAPVDAARFGFAAVSLGLTVLVLMVNWTTALLGILSWFLYVAIYTPLKTRSPFNTTIGAVSGALPIVMGWTAGGGALDVTALGLFLVLFLWQFPHFMAIAWLCKDDYQAAGYQMSTVVEPTGARAGAVAVAGAAMLLPATLLPVQDTTFSAVPYMALVTLINLMLLVVAGRFLWGRHDRSARRLLRASLLYLPLWLAVLCVFGR